MTEYSGKHVLVTGSTRGVGRLVSEHFLRHGAEVVGFARGQPTFTHEHYRQVEVDVAVPASVQRGFGVLKEHLQTLDVVVNNAAVLTSQYSMIMPPAAAAAMLNTNLLGPFMVSREAAKMMRKNKWGRIINIGSMAASLEPIGDSVYAATKSGLVTMTNVMARELGPLNVTCNTLAVSAIKTDMLSQLPLQKIEKVIAGLPLPRFAEPDDILNVIDFFASSRSGYITAQTISLGGVN